MSFTIRQGTVLLLLTLALSNLCGCGDSEKAKLEKQNADLSAKVDKLNSDLKVAQMELAHFKETDQSHYSRGIDLLHDAQSSSDQGKAASGYSFALAEFDAVIEKFPNSPLVPNAKAAATSVQNSIDEFNTGDRLQDALRARDVKAARRLLRKLKDYMSPASFARIAKQIDEMQESVEEEKYAPKSQSEAFSEWTRFRHAPNYGAALRGSVTTWKMKVHRIDTEDGLLGATYRNARLYLEGDSAYPVDVSEFDGSFASKGDDFADADWIAVTGKFNGYADDGIPELTPVRIKNLGYQGP